MLQPVLPHHLDRLREILGEEAVRDDAAALERYGRDETEDLCFPPAAAILPRDREQVSALLRYAHGERLGVTPRGAGTGLSGGALPVGGGLALSLERLDRILEIDERNLVARAESGVVTGDLQRAVEERGLLYPPDPASRDVCTLGGNLAEDSAGPRSCKYGTTRAWVLGLEAVLADGSVLSAGGANRKDKTGYNLTQLLIGSEGTLAVITAATLRLTAKPKATLTMVLPFGTLESAAAAVEAIFREGHDPAACELLEEAALAAVGGTLPLPDSLVGAGAMLLLELHGSSAELLLDRAAPLAELAGRLGAGEPLVAQDAAAERRLWQLRRSVAEAVKGISPYKEADTVVPRAALADLVRASRRVAEECGLRAICYGHAGDGNLHINLLRGALAEAEWERRRDRAELALFRAVVQLGGKITGEHGVGWTQRRYLPLAADGPSIEVMRAVKAAFDPRGILNPGKIFPDAETGLR